MASNALASHSRLTLASLIQQRKANMERETLGVTDQTLCIPTYESLTGWQLVEMIIADYMAEHGGKETV